jgi:maleate isomerase|tara:strand:+ start:153 stop:899 length:747 start_codon:yes stop_codon:yes gene_type:complete
MNSIKITPKFNSGINSKVGLIALSTDFMIEKDFKKIIENMNIDLFVNRIRSYYPLTKENLIKMAENITEVSKDILPDEKLDCVVYGCTSGTIASGYDSIKNKINLAKPEAKVVTPSSAAVNALRKMNVKKVSIFTPYSEKLNNDVVDYFKKENFTVISNSYFDILYDNDIAKVDPEYLFEVITKMDLGEAEAVFLSCTNLPALNIVDKLEKKLNKIVLSSNQVLIWDTLQNIKKTEPVNGFGKLFLSN